MGFLLTVFLAGDLGLLSLGGGLFFRLVGGVLTPPAAVVTGRFFLWFEEGVVFSF